MPTSPGIRFARLGSSTEPRHLIDTWLMIDPFRQTDYKDSRADYLQLGADMDALLGKSAKFIFIGQLDFCEELDPVHRCPVILEELGVDILRPQAHSIPLGVSLHKVPDSRWPGYWVMLLGWDNGRADWSKMWTYVLKQVS